MFSFTSCSRLSIFTHTHAQLRCNSHMFGAAASALLVGDGIELSVIYQGVLNEISSNIYLVHSDSALS